MQAVNCRIVRIDKLLGNKYPGIFLLHLGCDLHTLCDTCADIPFVMHQHQLRAIMGNQFPPLFTDRIRHNDAHLIPFYRPHQGDPNPLVAAGGLHQNSIRAYFSLDVYKRQEIVRSGYQIAQKEAGEQAVVAADLGMIYPEGDEQADPLPEYFALADAFLACGARTFLFETLAEIKPLLPVFSYLREKCPDCLLYTSIKLQVGAGFP